MYIYILHMTTFSHWLILLMTYDADAGVEVSWQVESREEPLVCRVIKLHFIQLQDGRRQLLKVIWKPARRKGPKKQWVDVWAVVSLKSYIWVSLQVLGSILCRPQVTEEFNSGLTEAHLLTLRWPQFLSLRASVQVCRENNTFRKDSQVQDKVKSHTWQTPAAAGNMSDWSGRSESRWMLQWHIQL